MSAAFERKRLETLAWRTCLGRHAVARILAAADRYKEAAVREAVGEAVARMTAGQMAALGRAEAEQHRRAAS
jgi:hypothetical protein